LRSAELPAIFRAGDNQWTAGGDSTGPLSFAAATIIFLKLLIVYYNWSPPKTSWFSHS